MRAAVAVLAMCMLLTGTINTIATKYQDIIVIGTAPDGTALTFRHPAVQSACMFLGESLCLIPYFIMRWQRRRTKRLDPAYRPMPAQEKRSRRIGRIMAFAVPTLCDATGTSLMNIGLFYTYASTYQMLRGTLVLFAGAFTVLLLRRQLFIHHWLGMVLITAGAALVGAASVIYPNTPSGSSSNLAAAFHQQQPWLQPELNATAAALQGMPSGLHYAPGVSRVASRGMLGVVVGLPGLGTATAGSSSDAADVLLQPLAGGLRPGVVPGLHVWSSALRDGNGPDTAAAPLFGDLLVVGAQMFTALQFILEEKFLVKYKVPALLAVGLEGCWGLVLCCFLLPVTTLIKGPDGLPLDDAPAALRAIWSNVELGAAVYLSIFSIAFFNFFGVSVTKSLSGAARATIDACRTVFIWLYALHAGWESFHALEVVGFVVLISGTSLYNEILKTCLPGASGDGGRQTPLPRHSGSRRQRASSRGAAAIAAAVAGGGGGGDASLTTPLLAAEDGKGAAAARADRCSGGDAAPAAAGGADDDDAGGEAASGRARRAPPVPLRCPAPAHTRGAAAAAQSSGASGSWGYHMARSMRLGIHTLSPQSLAAAGGLGTEDDDDDDDEGSEGDESASDIASSSYSSVMGPNSLSGGGGGALSSSLTTGRPGSRNGGRQSGSGSGGADAAGSSSGGVRVLRGFEGAGVLPGSSPVGAGSSSRQLGAGGVGGLTASLQAAAAAGGAGSGGSSRLRAASPAAGAAAAAAGGMPPLPQSASSGSLRRQSSSGNVRSQQQQ